VPDDILDNYFLKRVNARFFSEAKFGEKIQVYVQDKMIQNEFLVTMKSNVDGKLLAAAHTVWSRYNSIQMVA